MIQLEKFHGLCATIRRDDCHTSHALEYDGIKQTQVERIYCTMFPWAHESKTMRVVKLCKK